jgi:hypothetical protein
MHTQEAVDKARHAFRDYVTWSYATPHASRRIRLIQEHFQAQKHRLDSEAKAYFSVLVNEFHGPSMSGRKDAR